MSTTLISNLCGEALITGRIKDAEGKPVINSKYLWRPRREGAPPKLHCLRLTISDVQTEIEAFIGYTVAGGHYKVSVGSDPARARHPSGMHAYYRQTFLATFPIRRRQQLSS